MDNISPAGLLVKSRTINKVGGSITASQDCSKYIYRSVARLQRWPLIGGSLQKLDRHKADDLPGLSTQKFWLVDCGSCSLHLCWTSGVSKSHVR